MARMMRVQPNRSATVPAGEDPSRQSDAIDISVVVPGYFGAATIEACLTSLQCAVAHRRHEIIVVESSGDATAEIVRRRFTNVRVICSDRRLSAGAARNRGVVEASGPLIFFLDQDCIVPADWIERLERYFRDPTVGAAGGSVGIRDPRNLSGCAVYFLEFLNHFPGNLPSERDRNFLVGCNSAYRADVIKVVRFPDQTLGEDVLFSEAIRQNGFGVVYDPAVEVKHHNRTGWPEFFRYNREMGRSAAAAHRHLGRRWTKPFLRHPALAFAAPIVILPSIAIRLLRRRPSYLLLFLLVSPMCLLGNLAWAASFRREALAAGRRDATR